MVYNSPGVYLVYVKLFLLLNLFQQHLFILKDHHALNDLKMYIHNINLKSIIIICILIVHVSSQLTCYWTNSITPLENGWLTGTIKSINGVVNWKLDSTSNYIGMI